MPSTSSHTLVRSEREGISDDLLSFGPDAPTVLDEWTAADLLDHLIIREYRPHLALGAMSPVSAISDRAERAIEELRETTWVEKIELFRAGPARFSPVRPIDQLVNTGEYFVHHEDLLRAKPGWEPRDLGEPAERELWALLKRMARVLVRADVDVTLVSPMGGLRVKARRSEGSVRVHGPASELLLWAFGRDRVARVEVVGEVEAIGVLRRGDRGF